MQVSAIHKLRRLHKCKQQNILRLMHMRNKKMEQIQDSKKGVNTFWNFYNTVK